MTDFPQDGTELPEGFSSRWASTVGTEDGFALELLSDDEVVLEVYRDDLQQGALFLRTSGPSRVPLAAVHWLLETAAREMPAHVADEDRDYGEVPPKS
ncbi:hypothetical protein [Amnibacterium setariae]|uniref:Uncharacterized protein n=1 Tax=Amnibacterium setariae TaxID=2306585 RepID=A0A3A1TWS4_9MICO|nr:hypothetical protein [Amnibacterium setariae]RIX28652.1 hypothetical protein D1781_14710 [Amnibacterium setariae]